MILTITLTTAMLNLQRINNIIYLLENKGFICFIDNKILYIKKIDGDTVKQRAELIENLCMMVVDDEFIVDEIERIFQ